MKHWKLTALLATVLILTLALAACTSPAKTGTFENGGKKLSVPAEYADLVIVETSEDEEMFRVSEKASVEAAKAQGDDYDGAGWLFSISMATADQIPEMLCNDMSGTEIFAKDESGMYYLYNHPTDVTMVRENYDNPEKDFAEWGKLNEWAWGSVRDTFVAENEGLTAEAYTNTDLDIRLARLAYLGEGDYTISTTEYGPMAPNGVDPAPFLDRLRSGVTIAYADGEEAPDGEYVVLAFPEDGVRFDFFRMEGKENYVREVWSEDNDALFRMTYADGETKAAEIMQEWYDALVASGVNVELGYTADDLVGVWAEKIAGRGVIEITARDDGKYDVQINWGNTAAETYVWTMTAEAGNGGELRYDDGKLTIVTFREDNTSTEEVRYENGTGTFLLNSAGEIQWQDDMEHAGDDTVFVSAN